MPQIVIRTDSGRVLGEFVQCKDNGKQFFIVTYKTDKNKYGKIQVEKVTFIRAENKTYEA